MADKGKARESSYYAALMKAKGINGVQGINLFAWGNPGGGKSSMIIEAVEKAGFEPIVITLSYCAPEDALGLPYPVTEEVDDPNDPEEDPEKKKKIQMHVIKYLLNHNIQKAVMSKDSGRPCAIIWDDFTAANKSVQKVVLRLINERRLENFSLTHVPQIAIANPLSNGGYAPLDPAVANRFIHIDSEVFDTWYDWFVESEDTSPNIDFEHFDEEFINHFATYSGLARAFLMETKGKDDKMYRGVAPADMQKPLDHAWATGRAWDATIRAAAACEAAGLPIDPVVNGGLGEVVGQNWLTYINDQDLPKPSEVLSGSFNWSKYQMRPDKMRIISETAARAVQTEKQLDILLDACKEAQLQNKGDAMFPSLRVLAARARQKDKFGMNLPVEWNPKIAEAAEDVIDKLDLDYLD